MWRTEFVGFGACAARVMDGFCQTLPLDVGPEEEPGCCGRDYEPLSQAEQHVIARAIRDAVGLETPA